MVLDLRVAAFPFSSETVWNAGLSATGSAGGHSLSAGFEGDWAPEHLLLLAIESCYMSTFLSLAYAAGLEVLGYVSNARFEQGTAHQASTPLVSLSACIVVGTADDAVRAHELVVESTRASAVARLVGSRLTVSADVRVVPDRSD